MVTSDSTLVLGGTGTIGSQVVRQLRDSGHEVRVGSRHGEIPFDWSAPETWEPVLSGVGTMYVVLPDRTELPATFLGTAERADVRRVVLLSDRGIDIMNVTHLQKAERAVRDFCGEWTIVRADWFDQDFETFFRPAVLGGRLCVPVGAARQGFVDAADIGAVMARVGSSGDYAGRVLSLTGPRALSFSEALELISQATGRSITFDGSPEAFREAMSADGLPVEAIDTMAANFANLAARGDTELTGDVQEVLGRPARDFAAYVNDAADRGVWREG
ncbi:NmrA family transcriptional regulator [Actinoplanes sp. NPDC051859]|uniref:NmrA family transcriptional regulator n=1 Tax=Actinoplanes sp. NPDC051859 TaxID=3363909 RepID=UPI00378C4CF8